MAQEATGEGGPTIQAAHGAPTAPFVLSLLAGLLMLDGGGMIMIFAPGPAYSGAMRGYYGMMNGYFGMMQGFGSGGWWFYGAAVAGLISGIVVLVGAIMLYSRPRGASTWGSLILIFSIISFLGTGGFFIGALLGIVGGVLAMTWRSGGPQN